MKQLALLGVAAVLALGACNRASEGASPSESRGRYSGVGLYPAGSMWAQIAHPQATDPAAAKLSDDEQVIVVVDSRTGEVRQCGNLSGYCIGLNPWSGALAAGQRTAAPLVKHAEQLEQEAAHPAAPVAVTPKR